MSTRDGSFSGSLITVDVRPDGLPFVQADGYLHAFGVCDGAIADTGPTGVGNISGFTLDSQLTEADSGWKTRYSQKT